MQSNCGDLCHETIVICFTDVRTCVAPHRPGIMPHMENESENDKVLMWLCGRRDQAEGKLRAAESSIQTLTRELESIEVLYARRAKELGVKVAPRPSSDTQSGSVITRRKTEGFVSRNKALVVEAFRRHGSPL